MQRICRAGGAANSFVVPGGLSLPALFEHGTVWLVLTGVAVAILLAFLLTVILGFDDPVEDAQISAVGGNLDVRSPLDGTIVPLSEVPDPAFAGGTMGNGVAIQPSSGVLYAPFDGTVLAAFPTGHAIGLKAADGTELLIHIGLDTVNLNGAPFELKVKRGDQFAEGSVLVEFDIAAIEAAGYSALTPLIITNSASHKIVGEEATGDVKHGEPLFFVEALEPEIANK